jgi:C4-dicarboxylate transporter, DctQ subunit
VKAFTERVGRCFDLGLDILMHLSGLMLLASMLAISTSTITRNFFGFTIPSTGELSTYMLLYTTMLAAPWILREGHHIAIDILPLPEKAKSVIDVVMGLVTVLLFSFMSLVAYRLTVSMYESGYTTATSLALPRYLLVGIVLVGLILLTAQLLRNLARQLQAVRRGNSGSGTTRVMNGPTDLMEG